MLISFGDTRTEQNSEMIVLQSSDIHIEYI